MDATTLIIGVVGVAVIVAAVMLFRSLQQSFERTSETLREQFRLHVEEIGRSQQSMHQRLDNAAQTVGRVHTELGRLTERSQRIVEIGKDIQDLQQLLKAPKLRGGFGEYFLADLLENILPQGSFKLQHGFKSGARVDAVIKLRDLTIPVDAKFPLENFKKYKESNDEKERGRFQKQFLQDIKTHINAIADKYINPGEGTSDFAIMYIPAESVYYEIVATSEAQSMLEYSFERKVILTSPSNFYAYLQAISMGLRGLQIEQSAKDMLSRLSHLRGDFQKFEETYRVLGKHLYNAKQSYDTADGKLATMDQTFLVLEGSDQPKLPIDDTHSDK